MLRFLPLFLLTLSYAMPILAAQPLPPSPPWETRALADHPLVGRIWSPAQDRFVSPHEAADILAEGDFIMLGEKHDNPDHHRLQAWVTERILASGRRLAVGFEMMDADKAPALAAHLAKAPRDGAGLGAALDWDKTGWPEWKMYLPIAQAALDRGLPLIAANLPRATVKKLGWEGVEALPAEEIARLGLDQPLPDAFQIAMEVEIRQAHCNQLPAHLAPRMVDVQRAKDASMARELLAASPGGALLITGSVHARKDRSVPMHLKDRHVTAVAFTEVDADRRAPSDYADAAPYDLLWFTPRVDELDPCEKYADQLNAFKHKKK